MNIRNPPSPPASAAAKMPEVADKIKFFIGDVRSLESCRSAMPGVDYIFHAAALKQVPSCEFFPIEAVKTNAVLHCIDIEEILLVYKTTEKRIEWD